MPTTFKDLSLPLRLATIGGWITLVVYTIGFVLGFISGVMGW